MGGKGSGNPGGGPGRPREGKVEFKAKLAPKLAGRIKGEAKYQGITISEFVTKVFEEHFDILNRGPEIKSNAKPLQGRISESTRDISNQGPEMKNSFMQRPFSLNDFSELVSEIAIREKTRKFFESKAFICSVWEQLRQEQPWALTEKAFHDALVVANRENLLGLSCADLVGAMDPQDVARSEVRFLNASFHFINIGSSDVGQVTKKVLHMTRTRELR